MNLDNCDTLELQDRFDFLLKEYSTISFEIAGKLEKFGKIRSELQLLLVELEKRGQKTDGPENLKKEVEEKLKEHGDQSDKREGRSESGEDSK